MTHPYLGLSMTDKDGRAKLAEELRLLAKMLLELHAVVIKLQYLTAATYDAAKVLQNDSDNLPETSCRKQSF